MKDNVQDDSILRRGRFLGSIGILFALQTVLIFLFGARQAKNPASPLPTTQFRALDAPINEEQLRRLFFASDPTVFFLPGLHGFSGRAWMNQSPEQFKSTNELEPPLWLSLDTAQLGRGMPILNRSSADPSLALLQEDFPQVEPLPVFVSGGIVQTQAVFQLGDGLDERLLGPAPVLRVWPGVKHPTLVQIAVNRAGDVIASRLLEGSGSPDADANALAIARTLQFRPVTNVQTEWARATFQWEPTAAALTGTQP